MSVPRRSPGAGSAGGTGVWRNPWTRLWRDLTAAPEFFAERRSQPLELAEAVAEPVLSVALTAMLVAGVASFAAALAPRWNLSGITPMAAAITATGFAYGRRLHWSGIIWREWIVLLVPFLLVWRAFTALKLNGPMGAVLGGWLAHPGSVLDGPFTIGAALLLFAWTQGIGYARDLTALHTQLDGSRPQRHDPNSRAYWEEDERRHMSYLPAPRGAAERWLRGGVVLAVLSALGAAGVRQALSGDALMRLVTLAAPDESAALPNVLIYLLGGLVLVGLAESARLRTNWAYDAVAVMPGMARRVLLGLTTVVLVALAAAMLLPTHYAVGLGDLLRFAVALAAYAGNLITVVVFGALAWIIMLIANLFGAHAPIPGATRAMRPPALPPLHGGAATVLGSILFWGAALTAIGYCAYMLLRQAEGKVPGLRHIRALVDVCRNILGALLARAFRVLRRGAMAVADAVRQLGGGDHGRTGARLPRRSSRHMGPRERVAMLYLAVEERARRLGVPRTRGQTAVEYSRRLRREMPDLDPDLSTLTDVFLEARYSAHPFGDEQVTGARKVWQRVRARLRGRRPRG